MKIPDEWTISTVGEECVIRNDLRMPISIEERKKIEGTYPYYGPTGILGFINDFRVYGKFALIGEDGDHFLKYKTKSQTLLVNDKFNVNNHAHVIGDSKTCLAEWFYVYFQHKNLEKYLTRQGAGRYKLTKQSLSDISILLPPIEEQKAITAILSTWDEAIEKTKRLIELQEHRKAFLLQKYFNENSDHKNLILADVISEIGDGGTPSRLIDDFFGGNIPWVVIEDIEREIYKTKECLTQEGFKKCSTKLWPKGAIILSTGATIGVVGLAMIPVCTKQGITGIVPNHKVLGSYLMYYFQANLRLLIRYSQGSSIKEIRSEILKKLPIQVPCIERQEVISNLFTEIDKEIHNLKRRIKILNSQKQGLMQKLLTGKWRANFKEEK